MNYASMVIGAAAAGMVFGILAAYLLSWLMQDGYDGWGGLIGAVMGMIFGYPVGVFMGITIFKNLLHYNGSLVSGLIGVAVGGLLPFILAEPVGLNNHVVWMWAFIMLSSPLLGTIGFNLRKKTAPAVPKDYSETNDNTGQP